MQKHDILWYLKKGTFKFQIWEGEGKTNMIIANYTGTFTYDKDNYILQINFPIDGLLHGKKDFNTYIFTQFKVKELTLKRLLLDVIEEDELSIFLLDSTWEMNKNFDHEKNIPFSATFTSYVNKL